jgi:hypothetical protein
VEKALGEAADELDGTAGRRALRKLRRKLPTVLVAGPAPR